MPVHNGGEALRAALASVFAQSFTDFEVIVADDCSTDGTADVLRRIDDPRLRVLTNETNLGAAGSRNRAIGAAASPLLAILDADDMMAPLRLATQVAHLDAHPELAGVAGATERFAAAGTPIRRSIPFTSPTSLAFGMRYGPSFSHGTLTMRRSAFEEVGGYRTAAEPAEDYDLYARLLAAGHRIGGVDENALFEYDQPIVLTALASHQLPRNWRVGSRFRFGSGNPYTPVTNRVQRLDDRSFRPVYGERDAERLPPFYQLDVRVDKDYIFRNWKLTAYLDLQNATNAQNVEVQGYNYDYSEEDPVTGLPLLPAFGFRGEW